MKYRRMGKSGLKLSELSYGSWVTFGGQLDIDAAKKNIRYAFDQGINFFDTAEAYAEGVAELIMGEALKYFRREDLVVSTKLYWGGSAPNQTGLSRKHIIEGLRNSLKRLQMEYVDIVFAHRPDPETPIEETVLAMDYLVRNGLAFYWGTSEWTARQIAQAIEIAGQYNAVAPSVEQPQYNMLVREKLEKDYLPLFEDHGLGTTIWSPLASGILTGKYNDGIPEGSRLAMNPGIKGFLEKQHLLDSQTLKKVRALGEIAKDLNCSLPQLAIAWCLKNEHVSTVLLGASGVDQLEENLKALEVAEKIDDYILQTVDSILKKKP